MTLYAHILHKLTQSMGSKRCVFVKCQSLPSYLLPLVPLVVFLQTECIAEERRENDVGGNINQEEERGRRRRRRGAEGGGGEGQKEEEERGRRRRKASRKVAD